MTEHADPGTLRQQAETGLTDPGQVAPDDLLLAWRITAIPGLYGATSYVHETGRLIRAGRAVILNVPAVGPLAGDVRMQIADDVELAAIAFRNEVDALRRDGWTVRDPEPWERHTDDNPPF